jgi:murein DD-endopeptidase MepM/ murein hydrolase activator NlpD
MSLSSRLAPACPAALALAVGIGGSAAATAQDAPPVTVSRAGDALGAPASLAPAGRPIADPRLAGRARAARLTSGFGLRPHPLLGGLRFHQGIDLAAHAGAPVYSAAAGTVAATGWHGGYGLLVTVRYPQGMQSRYAHLSGVAVSPGQPIRKGQLIGFVGATGRTTGPHLHYEVRVNGAAINPLPSRR